MKPLPRGTAFRLHLPVRAPEAASGPAPASEGGMTGVEPTLSESGVALE